MSARLNTDAENCKITDAHYFRGRSVKAGNEKAIIGERFFEDALTKEGVDLHYLPLIRGMNNELKEKGIDVSLALSAYKKAAAKGFDVFVLIAGDGDYLPLVRELQTMGSHIDVMLLSWDFETTSGDVTMTSQDLLEEVKFPLQMANIIDDRLNLKNPVITGLFEPRQVEAPAFQAGQALQTGPVFQSGQAFQTGQPPLNQPPVAAPAPTFAVRRKVLSEEEMAHERISTILSLDNTGGWIRDLEYNNFYFFSTDVINKKPEELAVGMTLQFRLKFDRVKTEHKDNGEPSYRAVGPILAVD